MTWRHAKVDKRDPKCLSALDRPAARLDRHGPIFLDREINFRKAAARGTRSDELGLECDPHWTGFIASFPWRVQDDSEILDRSGIAVED